MRRAIRLQLSAVLSELAKPVRLHVSGASIRPFIRRGAFVVALVDLVAPVAVARAQSGTIQFSFTGNSASETGSLISISVSRSGGTEGAVQVTAATDNSGTATGGTSCGPGVDFVHDSQTLSWPDGEFGT